MTKRQDQIIKLDVRGYQCPIPVLKLAKLIETLEKFDVIEVLATDPLSQIDIPAFCQEKQHKVLSIHVNNDQIIHFTLKVSGLAK